MNFLQRLWLGLGMHWRRTVVRYSSLIQWSRIDKLTGLPNRDYIMDWYKVRGPNIGRTPKLQSVAAAMIDLDKFKMVNDKFGHITGDSLLVEVARRLLAEMRPGEFLGRLAGDEFVMFIVNPESSSDLYVRLTELDRSLKSRPYPITIGSGPEVARVELPQQFSIGFHILDRPSHDIADILHPADLAMQKVKVYEDSYDNIRVASFNKKYGREAEIRQKLSVGLANAQLDAAYMPIVDLLTMQTIGFESLFLPDVDVPEEYDTEDAIETLDLMGLLPKLVEFQLEAAARNLPIWQQLSAVPLTVSVNATARQVESGSLLELVEKQLANSRLQGCQLVIEVTEGKVVYEPNRFLEQMYALQSLGCKVVMDDYGRANSALERLYPYNWDGVKLDKSFVATLAKGRSQNITRQVIRTLRVSDTKVTIEWLRTEEQAKTAALLGCNYGQGELFGPTHLTEAEVSDYLQGL